MESPDRVQAAWIHAKGDVKRATELLSDPLWADMQVSPTHALQDTIGRVREIDEANKAQRVAVKEKGKKSMIYANRPILEAKPPSVSTPIAKPVGDLRKPLESPETPVPVPIRRKRIKKLVVDSDSDLNFVDSEEDERIDKRGRPDNSNESRTLDYFNVAGAEALQELIGMSSV